MLRHETASDVISPDDVGAGLSATHGAYTADRDCIFFKNDRIYRHQLARINYTTYDVRRSQNVIHAGTPHRDIMLLANNGGSDDGRKHPFLYARVLGIYHTNVIYTGEGMRGYTARKMEFLWVRWFHYDGDSSVSWQDSKLDSIRFPPMASEAAFGFVDPADLLRAAHIVPAFASGRARLDGLGLSPLAQDACDWSRYYVNRYTLHACMH